MEVMAHDLDVKAIEYHRNGISGIGFYVVLFGWMIGKEKIAMMATVFDVEDHGFCAVIDVKEAAAGHVGDGNKWRGDNFEKALREVIKRKNG